MLGDFQSSIPNLVLGAGLCGLSCAYHLGDGSRYRLLEREAQVGGLARTRTRPGGFLCDGTGHWLHLARDYTRSLVAELLGDNLEVRTRQARVFSQGVFTRYPFQANLHGLPTEVIVECLLGLVAEQNRPSGPDPRHYLEWIHRAFGAGICRHFMVPYNSKVYGVPLDTLAANFADRYIPRPALETVLRGALGPSEERLGYNARFQYPRRGGIGALAEALHARLPRPAEPGRVPRGLDLDRRLALLNDGEVVHFERLISTIPLPELVNCCLAGNPAAVPEAVATAAARLRSTSVLYFDVGVRGVGHPSQNFHWVYFPEPEFAFYRIGSYTAVEPSLAPPGHRSYYVEFGQQAASDPGRLESAVVEGLRRAGLIADEDQILFLIPTLLSPAYVLFDHHYEASRSLVVDWLAARRVLSVGRYGGWAYTSMEDALLEGQQAALQSA